MTLFVLYYEPAGDEGDRESCSIFYTPMEIFETDDLRQKRIDFLQNQYKDLDLWFEKQNHEFNTNVNEVIEHYEDNM